MVGLAFGIVLGRLLAPSDYGMMAMISIFSLVATALQESGFRTALTNLKDPRPEDYNSVFWFNIVVATTLYTLLFFAAPLIGDYYHTERVVPLCRYAFLSIIIASLGTAQSAYLFKHLKAKSRLPQVPSPSSHRASWVWAWRSQAQPTGRSPRRDWCMCR